MREDERDGEKEKEGGREREKGEERERGHKQLNTNTRSSGRVAVKEPLRSSKTWSKRRELTDSSEKGDRERKLKRTRRERIREKERCFSSFN